ncbi:MAG TPA: family 78 glycoside hydrolase catalytic domain [bacterium]|nr:family 78 glycoside hydrolase catalytic domain [bacterium]
MSGFRKCIVGVLICVMYVIIPGAGGAQAGGAYPEGDKWNAGWIWCEGEESPGNFFVYMRKSFNMPADAAMGSIRVTADSRYRLFVNGRLVGQGPVKSDRRWLYYDEWDVKSYLKPGENVVAVLVHSYGEWTFSYVEGRGGLLLEAVLEAFGGQRVKFGTDSTWKVMPGLAWRRDLDRMSVQQDFPEIFDSRKEPKGWNDTGFDDSGWANAVEIGTPPMEPWTRLVPRTTPNSYETRLSPVTVIETGESESEVVYQGVNFELKYPGLKYAVAYAVSYMYLPEKRDVTIKSKSRSAEKIWLGRKMILTNYLGPNAHFDEREITVSMGPGWVPMMVKSVDAQRVNWDFDIRFDMADCSGVVFSPYKDEKRKGWMIVGPFQRSGDIYTEYLKDYPPQKKPDFGKKYKGIDGKEVAWEYAANTDYTTKRLGSVLAGMKRQPAKAVGITGAEAVPGGGEATVVTGAGKSGYIVFDFGREVSGYPNFEIESADGGEIIDMGYAEVLEDEEGKELSPLNPEGGHVNCSRGRVNYADRYIASEGSQRWETFEKRAFRYMLLVVRDAEKPLKIKNVGLRFSTYDVGDRGSFESSDEVLNRIWDVGAYTLQLNMDDSYTDCPWRERGQWWGDARIEILVNYYSFGDTELARRGILQIGESQREDGLVAGIYPTDWDNRWLPDYALVWIMSAMDYIEYTGDESLLEELLPRYRKMLDGFFTDLEDENGLLRDVPHWVFIDWAPIEKRGAIAALNAYYYRGLRDAARQFRIAGEDADADRYDAKAQKVKDAVNRLMWDPEAGAYADCYADGKRCGTISRQANSLIVINDIAPPEKQKSIMKYVMDPDAPVVRAGSPYFSFYILKALRHVGMDAEAMDYIMKWKQMLDWGATTWWEVWGTRASHCHAWSSAPNYDLSRNILGVSPAGNGYEKVLVAPIPGNLEYARGVVPTTDEDIPIEWHKKADPAQFVLKVTIPEFSSAEVRLPLGEMKNPVLKVNGDETLPDGVENLGIKDGYLVVETDEGGEFEFLLIGE